MSSNESPFRQDFAQRMRVCVERAGGKRAFADACNLSESQVYRLISGKASPTVDDVFLFSSVSKVDPVWILTGSHDTELSAKGRPPFRPELLTQLTQLLDEALQDQPYRLSPLQRAKVLTFFYEAACHEEKLTQRPAFINKAEILGGLDYLLAGSPLEEGIDLHTQAMRLSEKWEQPPEDLHLSFLFQRWVKLVVDGQRDYMNNTQGEAIFNTLGYELSETASGRLRDMMKRVLEGRGTRDFNFLDIGCGNARDLAFLFQNYPFIKPKGIDVSERAIELSRLLESNGKLPKGTILQGSALELPFPPNSFDMVYSRFTLGFIPTSTYTGAGSLKAIQEIARVLKPGGTAEIIVPFGEGRDYLPFRQRYTRQTFEDILSHVPELKLASFAEVPTVSKIAYRFEEKFTHRGVVTLKKV